MPQGLAIPVEIDGLEVGRVDTALLEAARPDVEDANHRAWKLAALLPGKPVAGKPVEVETAEGTRAPLVKPGEPLDGREPYLELARGGTIRVVLGVAGGPPPAGAPAANEPGAAGRPPRRIRLGASANAPAGGPGGGAATASTATAGKAKPAVSSAPIELRAQIDGASPVDWTSAHTKVHPYLLGAQDGEGKREAWPLRELAREIAASPDAEVIEVSGDDGQSLAIAPAEWSDPSRIPVLRANRRGVLKLTWLDKSLEPAGGEEMREITMLKVMRHARTPKRRK